MGLIIVVNNTRDDYFYNIFNTIGFSVKKIYQLFN